MLDEALTELEILGLRCVAEGMAALIFDETVLQRLIDLGLVEARAGDVELTEAGRRCLAA